MKQLNSIRKIFKIHSKFLKKNKYDLKLSVVDAMRTYPENVVSIGASQMLRFIDELRGTDSRDDDIRITQNRIRSEKRKQRSAATKKRITELYDTLYELQFIRDYVCIIMDSMTDYDYLNQNGFSINGQRFRRLLGTNGGIKKSTIVYVSEELYPELKRRIDNGRDMTAKLVPAKLEAYQALVCSGSTPLPKPKGIIVVKDCITKFKETVIEIDDSGDGEPLCREISGYEIEHNDSDGYGLMLPSYSAKVNDYLGGTPGKLISGMNTRYAWTKGMVYTFDFIDFAEKIAGSYEITDVWGHTRDVRNVEVILTESMLKLWDCYSSWEDYYENCEKNGYELSATKVTPYELESTRSMNYQFLQSYDLNEEEIGELCFPTASEIENVLGLDYRKSLVYLAGFGMNEDTAFSDDADMIVKALMAEPEVINDPFVRKKIWGMIEKRIEAAKRGCIDVHANYAMISGDPYALCQSMFGLEITGLLSAWEVYHKYWIDKGADEIVCFRAPMTGHNNIRKMRLNKSDQCLYWYQYINSALIYNAWDTACDAMNGSDFDGDTNMCTDNSILMNNTKNELTIMCMQKRAEKTIPTEEDIITANKLAFNDDIGTVTNRVTSMFERQAAFDRDSEEYKILSYRIKCGQLYQQCTID